MNVFGALEDGYLGQMHRISRYNPIYTNKELVRINTACLQLAHEYPVTCYAMITPDYVLHLANNALCKILGCKEYELLQTDIRELIKPDERSGFSDLLEKQKTQSETSAYGEKICLCFNGRYVWVNIRAISMQSPQNQPSFYILLMDFVSFRRLATVESDNVRQKILSIPEFVVRHDDTKRMRTTGESMDIKKRNSLSNEMLAFALDQTDDIVLITDENTKIIFTNQKACELLGYSQDQLLAMHIADIAPDMEDELNAHFPLAGNDTEASSVVQMFCKTRNKRVFPVEVKISPCKFFESYFFFVAKEISTHREIYDMLWHNEQKFVAFVENSPNIIVRYDLSLCCIYVNEALEKIIGFSRRSVIERFVDEPVFLPEAQIQLMKTNLRMVINSGLPMEFELVVLHAISNLPVHLHVNVVPEFNTENKISGVIAVCHDITQLKYQEEELRIAKLKAEESSRMKSIFLGTISHEIRTPLNAIIGFSRLLKDETLASDDRNECIDLIDESGMRLINVVEEILDLSKIESGKIELHTENYDACTILKEQYHETNEILRLKQTDEVAVGLDCNCVDMLFYNDKKLIRQVLKILAGNAVKFTKKGKITLGIQGLKQGFITFYVSDTGIGIPVEKQESIFEPFVQVDNSRTRAYDGLGIGLSLGRRIARALAGDITLISTLGEGSTFYFSVPIIAA